jgi:hypothetical protein
MIGVFSLCAVGNFGWEASIGSHDLQKDVKKPLKPIVCCHFALQLAVTPSGKPSPMFSILKIFAYYVHNVHDVHKRLEGNMTLQGFSPQPRHLLLVISMGRIQNIAGGPMHCVHDVDKGFL